MTDDKKKYSLRLIKLFVDFFQHAISEIDHDELDNWVCASDDNLLVFESVVEIAAGLMLLETYGHLNRKNMQKFKDIFNQMEKQVTKTITDEEKEKLWQWAKESEDHRIVFETVAMP